jgi:hypothetical protein
VLVVAIVLEGESSARIEQEDENEDENARQARRFWIFDFQL